jgi:hypothetical protein
MGAALRSLPFYAFSIGHRQIIGLRRAARQRLHEFERDAGKDRRKFHKHGIAFDQAITASDDRTKLHFRASLAAGA